MKKEYNDFNSDAQINIDKYKTEPKEFKDNGIYPYLEALSYFNSIKEISNNFVQKYKNNNHNPNLPFEFNSFKDFIDYFKNLNFYNINNQIENQKKELLVKNPIKIYYDFLDELHKLFKNNIIEKNYNANEYDCQKAKQIFKDFAKNDKSYISDLFFGEKRIEKKCKNCNLTNYIYNYLKIIPLNVGTIKGKCNLENLINSIQKCQDNKLFCDMCSSVQNCEIKIKITKKPKILIILIFNLNHRIIIKIPKYLFKKSYKLNCAEFNNDRGKLDNSIFSCLCKSCSKNKKNDYKIAYYENSKYNNNDLSESNMLNDNSPYVLFYKRINDKEDDVEDSLCDNNSKKIISSERFLDDNKLENNNNMPNNEVININNNFINNNINENFNFNNNMNNNNNMNVMNNNNMNIMNNNNMNFMNNNNMNFMNNNNMNFINNNNINFINNNNMNVMNNNNMNFINNNMNVMNNNTNNNINNNMNNNINNNLIDNNSENDKNDFILYFRFKKNGKEIFIETNENETFSKIVVKIKINYEWAIEMIDDNNLYYNKEKINPKKTPKQLNIPTESRIMIY